MWYGYIFHQEAFQWPESTFFHNRPYVPTSSSKRWHCLSAGNGGHHSHELSLVWLLWLIVWLLVDPITQQQPSPGLAPGSGPVDPLLLLLAQQSELGELNGAANQSVDVKSELLMGFWLSLLMHLASSMSIWHNKAHFWGCDEYTYILKISSLGKVVESVVVWKT